MFDIGENTFGFLEVGCPWTKAIEIHPSLCEFAPIRITANLIRCRKIHKVFGCTSGA